jgi:imidazole glycerol-phosphate synthase
LFDDYRGEKLYFVHSYHARVEDVDEEWLLATTDYGEPFVSGICRGNIAACQFHPEKSGVAGLGILKQFLQNESITMRSGPVSFYAIKRSWPNGSSPVLMFAATTRETLVVTKGDQYDVRADGQVRNLGKPVELAQRYFEEGADEITFLNITGFRDFPLADEPMLEVLRRTSEKVFVPLTIGGGIRAFTDSNGVFHSALDVASEYFRSGADKISIGSDAVYTVETLLATGRKTGESAIEQISLVYGAQAVVISVDPRRVYVSDPGQTPHRVIRTAVPGPAGEAYCWYQCTVKGGREGRDLDVIQLVTACEQLGAGEILLNCIDRDGTNSGFDLELINHVKEQVRIPVIASSGAGTAEHFVEVFEQTDAEAALAAGIFHRREVGIQVIKEALAARNIAYR